MNVLLFEDEKVTHLYPITVGRPAFAISCGALRLIDLFHAQGAQVRIAVRTHLTEITKADFPQVVAEFNSPGPVLMVNARMAASIQAVRRLLAWANESAGGLVRVDGSIVAALLPADSPALPQTLRPEQVEDFLSYVGLPAATGEFPQVPLLEHPHDVVREHLGCIGDNLTYRIEHGEYREVADGVFLAEGAKLGEHVVCDTSDGPIVMEREATVGPHSYMAGPVHIGEKARILEHASIKDAVALGHTTKIGGEVEASIIEPYTNKQHHGFLGHAYLGSWINLGAGTCNSDLKNTYGNVKMEYRGRRVSTGMQFVGCFLGDYAKTAINTSIFTGKVIGTCSMVYGFVTTNVPSYVNYARSFGQVTELPPEVMISTQQRMFARRNVQQRPCDMQLLRDMYELTRDERQLAGEPLAL